MSAATLDSPHRPTGEDTTAPPPRAEGRARTVLIISRRFPPAFNVGGKRAYRFAKYLGAHGWRAVVWTGPRPEGYQLDQTPYGLDEACVERSYEPRWWPQPDLAYAMDAAPAADTGSLKRRLKDTLSLPVGRDVLLTPRAALILRRLCRREGVDMIVASSGPYATLVQAWAASALTGVPFCLDLRDPWSLNFLQRGKPAWVRACERRVERRLFERAARVFLTCEDATEAYRSLYAQMPPERFATVTNSFDPDFRLSRAEPSGPVTLVHFGNCHGPRSLEIVLRAMHRVRERGRWPAEGLLLVNLGKVGEHDVRLAESLDLGDSFRHSGPLPFAEGAQLLARADLKILLGYAEEKLYIPAKAFDYLLTPSPILCVAAAGALTRLVEGAGVGRVVSPSDVDGAADAVVAAAEARRGRLPLFNPRPEVIERYDARFTAGQLAAHLDEVVSARRRQP